MNAKIKEILEKYEPNSEWWFKATKININKAIIEICEAQMEADNIEVDLWFEGKNSIKLKNIAL